MDEGLYISFESYLANEMPVDAKKQFEEKLQNDTQFKQNFDLYVETSQFLQAKFATEAVHFRHNLKSISSEHFPAEEASKVVNLKPWYYAVAASMVIVFGILVFNQSDPQYGDYNQHETAVFTERGDADLYLKQAQDFFNARDYKKAVVAFEKISNVKNPEIQYYYAIALIETSSYQKAATILNDLKNGTSVYKEKATWYLALSNLKQNKIDECKALLQQIPPGAEDYEKAKELLDDLD